MNKINIYEIKLSGSQLQEIFGISHMTVYRWKKRGMPYEQDGGKHVYYLKDVEDWMKANGVKVTFK